MKGKLEHKSFPSAWSTAPSSAQRLSDRNSKLGRYQHVSDRGTAQLQM